MIGTNIEDIEIKITSAGKAYLEHIVASFEYFSFRYYKGAKYKPLFAAIPSKQELQAEKNFENFECYKIINNVLHNVEKCLKEMQRTSYVPINIGEKRKSKSHSIRIIEHHQGYIDHFIRFLKEVYGEDSCRALIEACIKCRDRYNEFR